MKTLFLTTLAMAANLFIAGAIAAPAQSPKPAPSLLDQRLEHLAAVADQQLDSLPNFTCNEDVISQIIENKKVRSSTRVHGTVRVTRKPDGALDETYTYKRPFHLLIIPAQLPYFVRGGFASPLTYFLAAAQPCYRYSLSPGRIDFATRSNSVPGHICQDQGLEGFALLNPAGDVTHVQRTLPEAVAKPLKLAPFAAIDIAPVTLNGRTYQLSQHMIAAQPIGQNEARFEATYTDCKLFTATVTLGPATEVPSPKPQ